MSALENYFKTRYIQRLEELREKIIELCVSSDKEEITESDYHAEFVKIYNQFTDTTRMHIKGFESQNVSHKDSDIKFTIFCSKDWLISYLAHNSETSEILAIK